MWMMQFIQLKNLVIKVGKMTNKVKNRVSMSMTLVMRRRDLLPTWGKRLIKPKSIPRAVQTATFLLVRFLISIVLKVVMPTKSLRGSLDQQPLPPLVYVHNYHSKAFNSKLTNYT